MVVTDPTIDPITGLPLLNPQDVIQQIPLGVQTFPYEDLQATARPTRNPLYGDDILPVSAFVAGQHPSTGSAQTVETDAAHAMKVFVVNGGRGTVADPGASMVPNNVWGGTYGISSGGGINDVLAVSIDIIYQLTWSFAMNGSATATPGPGSLFELLLVGPSRGMPLVNIALPTSLAIGDRFSVQSDTIVWPGGMDVRNVRNQMRYDTIDGVMSLQPSIVNYELMFWSSEGALP